VPLPVETVAASAAVTIPWMPGQAGHDETSMTKPSLPDATGNPQSEHAGPGFQLSTKTVLFVRNGELEVPEEYN